MNKQYPIYNPKRYQIISDRPFWNRTKNLGESNNRAYAVARAKEWAWRYQQWGYTGFIRVLDMQAFKNNEEEIIAVFASINGEIIECNRLDGDNVLKVLEDYRQELIEKVNGQ